MKYNRQTPCVYHSIKVVFHGIPKNASTSVKNILYEAEWGKPFEGNKQWIHKGNEKGGSIYPSIESIQSEEYRSYTHFTVVRNPYERFKSFYTDLFLGSTNLRANIPPFYTDNNIKLNKRPVNEVIDIITSYSDTQADEHFASQDSFIHSSRCLFIRMEDLNFGWQKLCEKIGIAFNPLPVYNKSNTTISLTESQKELIFNRYRTDFERFKYDR